MIPASSCRLGFVRFLALCGAMLVPFTARAQLQEVDRLTSLCFSRQGAEIAGTHFKVSTMPLKLVAEVIIWKTENGKILQRIRPSTQSEVFTIAAFSPDGSLLATGGAKVIGTNLTGDVSLWDLHTGRRLSDWVRHSKEVVSLAFSPDGKMLASGGKDKTIRLWDVNTRTELGTLRGAGGTITHLVFSPNNLLLASGTDDEAIQLWDPRTGESKWTVDGDDFCANENDNAFSVRSFVFASNNSTLIIGGDLWRGMEIDPPKKASQPGHQETPTKEPPPVPDSSIVGTSVRVPGEGDHPFISIFLIDLQAGKPRQIGPRTIQGLHGAVLSSDAMFVVGQTKTNSLSICDTRTGAVRQNLDIHLDAHKGDVPLVVFSPDGQSIIVLGDNLQTTLWDVRTGTIVRVLTRP